MPLTSAAREKLVAAERQATLVRLMLVAFAAVVYATLMDPETTWPSLAWGTLATAGAYSLYLLAREPYRRYGVLWTTVTMSVVDAVLVGAWIVATGGFASPFYLIWYLSLVALAFRYGPREALAGVGLYSAIYGGILWAEGSLWLHPVDVTVRLGFMALFGIFGALFSKVTLDQTVAKQTFQALAQKAQDTAEELEHALSLQEATLDSTADGILVVDNEGDIVAYNEQFREMWGIPEQVLATGDDEAAIEHVLDQLKEPEAFLAKIHALYGDPEAESHDVLEFEDGRLFERVSRPQELGGKTVGRVWSFRDVTASYRAKQALETYATELEDRNEQLQQFAYVVSHDLREPLRMVTSYLELLERRYSGQLDQDAEEFIEYAVDGARRMDRLIQDLVKYSQVTTEAEPFELTDLNVVVDQALGNLALVVEEAGAQVEVDDLPVIQADASQMMLVFQNLLSNAIKFHRPGVTPRVRIQAKPENGSWHVQVADNGIGIPEDQLDGVFTVFRRLHQAEEVEGSGIGLAICQRIVQRHSGKLWVESEGPVAQREGTPGLEPGSGSVFHIRLPETQQATSVPPLTLSEPSSTAGGQVAVQRSDRSPQDAGETAPS